MEVETCYLERLEDLLALDDQFMRHELDASNDSEFDFEPPGKFDLFKSFAMNSSARGLSVGEKAVFWLYKKLLVLSKKWFTHLFLSLCLALYCAFGAAVFMTLEGPYEQKYDKNLTDVRREVVNKVLRTFVQNTSLLKESDTTVLTYLEDYLIEYENNYTEHMKHLNNNDVHMITWNFWNSMFYSGTIFTTVGFGYITPKTVSGRLATIIYAVIGIPLFLIVLAHFGQALTRIIKFFWSFIRRFYYTRSCQKVRRARPAKKVLEGLQYIRKVLKPHSRIFVVKHERDLPTIVERKPSDGPPPLPPKPGTSKSPDNSTTEENENALFVEEDERDLPTRVERNLSDGPPPLPPKPGTSKRLDNETETTTLAPPVYENYDELNQPVPISLVIVILVVYIIIGTIGTYNYINCCSQESWSFIESFYFIFICISTIGLGDLVPNHPMFMMASIIYLIFGLALTFMCFDVIQIKLSYTFKQACAKLAGAMALKLAEEDGSLVPIPPTLIE